MAKKWIDTKAMLNYFELGDVECQDIGAKLMHIAERENYALLQSQCIGKIREWAEKNYPNAIKKDHESFATLVSYLATNVYAGNGTDMYYKERAAESKAMIYFYDHYRDVSIEERTKNMIQICEKYIFEYTGYGV